MNNTSKLKGIDERIERDTKKLKEVENDCTYNDGQRQLYRDGLDDLNIVKKQERSSNTSRKNQANH